MEPYCVNPSEKQFCELTVSEAEQWIQEEAQVVDVREPSEFAKGHIAE